MSDENELCTIINSAQPTPPLKKKKNFNFPYTVISIKKLITHLRKFHQSKRVSYTKYQTENTVSLFLILYQPPGSVFAPNMSSFWSSAIPYEMFSSHSMLSRTLLDSFYDNGQAWRCIKGVYNRKRCIWISCQHLNFFLLNLKYLTFGCPLLMVRHDFIWGTLFWPTGGAVLVVQFLTFKSLESIMQLQCGMIFIF